MVYGALWNVLNQKWLINRGGGASINFLLLMGPTIMIFLGLHVMNSIPFTFTLFYSWLLIIPVVYLIKEKLPFFESLNSLGLNLNKRALLYGIYTGIFCLIIIFGCVSLLKSLFFDIPYLRELLKEWGFSGKLLIVLIVLNPFLEEIYWRGFIFKKFKSKYGIYYTILITSLFYTLYHLLSIFPMFRWPLNILGVIPIFAAGILWGYLRGKFNSLSGTISSHILADIGIIMVYLKFLT
ncbi:MAG: CPBP family intramembrane glutamic endopeptidase [Bacillota bacterium]